MIPNYTGVPVRVTTPHRVEVTTLTHPHSKQLMVNRSVKKTNWTRIQKPKNTLFIEILYMR